VKRRIDLAVLMLTLIFGLTYARRYSNMLVSAEKLSAIRITGLIEQPLSFTHSDLLSLPMVSEVATCYCPFDGWEVTFNWTGVPVFHLLTLAEVKQEGASVFFHGQDGYTTNIRMREVLKPTTILALKGNGTDLSEITGREGGSRIVFPCKDGFNWVTNITEIEVTDKTFERALDNDRPNCVLPSIDPPLLSFNLTLGKREIQTRVFTNASIEGINIDYGQKQLRFNITIPAGKTGFAELIMPNHLLEGPYTVFLDEETVEFRTANVANLTFIYMNSSEASHIIRVVGERFYGSPEIIVEFNHTSQVHETVNFNATKSIDDGKIVSYRWDFGDNEFGSGAVVTHSYSREGVYQVAINITDNDGLSNLKLFTVTVEGRQVYNDMVRLVSAGIVSASIIILTILLLRRKPELAKRLFEKLKIRQEAHHN